MKRENNKELIERFMKENLQINYKMFNISSTEDFLDEVLNSVESNNKYKGMNLRTDFLQILSLVLLDKILSNKEINLLDEKEYIEFKINIDQALEYFYIKSGEANNLGDDDFKNLMTAWWHSSVNKNRTVIIDGYNEKYENKVLKQTKKIKEDVNLFTTSNTKDILLKNYAYIVYKIDKNEEIDYSIINKNIFDDIIVHIKELKKNESLWIKVKEDFIERLDEKILKGNLEKELKNKSDEYIKQGIVLKLDEPIEDMNTLYVELYSILRERFSIIRNMIDESSLRKEALFKLLKEKYNYFFEEDKMFDQKFIKEGQSTVLLFNGEPLEDVKYYRQFVDATQAMVLGEGETNKIIENFGYEEESKGFLIKYTFKDEYKDSSVAKLYNEILLERIKEYQLNAKTNPNFPIDMFSEEYALKKEHEKNLLNKLSTKNEERKKIKL